MNILILGGGGREHALARQIVNSPYCEKLFVAPGNAGTAEIAENLPMPVNDFEIIKRHVLENNIKMLVVGPEKPLVDGIYDYFKKDGALSKVSVIGPSSRGALLEGSKERAKEFMAMHDIPTAAYQAFKKESLEAGKRFLTTLNPPYVLKADGLAGGKGVLILNDLDQAREELDNMLTNEKFGAASETVIIEEFLDGIELSVFVLTDGRHYKILPTAKDYKRIGEGDTGLNTGGMGAVSPAVFADEKFMGKVEKEIIIPTVEGLQKEGIDYKGFIFFGLMKVGDGPYLIEYNVRMGDPESEVVLPRIRNDFIDVFQKIEQGRLNTLNLELDERHTATVMLVSGGYPESYEKGKEIFGLEEVSNAIVFHAGTRIDKGRPLTDGGRVLAVTAYGKTYKEALSEAYKQAAKIEFEGRYYRQDLGRDLEI